MKPKQKLIRKLFLITDIQFEQLRQLKKTSKYSYSELVRAGIDKIIGEGVK